MHLSDSQPSYKASKTSNACQDQPSLNLFPALVCFTSWISNVTGSAGQRHWPFPQSPPSYALCSFPHCHWIRLRRSSQVDCLHHSQASWNITSALEEMLVFSVPSLQSGRSIGDTLWVDNYYDFKMWSRLDFVFLAGYNVTYFSWAVD